MHARPAESASHGNLGLWPATALVATQVVAIGIFLTPAGMMHALGSPLGALLVWLVMGAMAWSGAWCFGRLAVRYPQSGGGYIYLRECFGAGPAFLFGWMSMWVMDVGVMAALAVGAASYCSYLIPLTAVQQKLLAALLPLLLGAAYMLAPTAATWGLRGLNNVKLLLVASLPVWILLAHRGSWTHFQPLWQQHAGADSWSSGVAAATIGGFFALAGWWEINKVAPLIRDPQRNLPIALSRGMALVTLLYILVSAAFLYLLPSTQMTSDQAFIAQAGGVLAGLWGARILAAMIIFCVAGAVGAMLLTTPHVYLGMARDGLFVPWLAHASGNGWTPRITVLQVVLIAILVMTGSFDAIVSYSSFAAVAFIALTAAGVLRLPSELRGNRIFPFAFLTFSAAVLVLLLHNPMHALAGAAIVALGWPVYCYLRTKEPAALPAREF